MNAGMKLSFALVIACSLAIAFLKANGGGLSIESLKEGECLSLGQTNDIYRVRLVEDYRAYVESQDGEMSIITKNDLEEAVKADCGPTINSIKEKK